MKALAVIGWALAIWFGALIYFNPSVEDIRQGVKERGVAMIYDKEMSEDIIVCK